MRSNYMASCLQIQQAFLELLSHFFDESKQLHDYSYLLVTIVVKNKVRRKKLTDTTERAQVYDFQNIHLALLLFEQLVDLGLHHLLD